MSRNIAVRVGCGALLLAAIVANGCGGEMTAHYTASTTVDCLEDRPTVTDLNTSQRDLDFLAPSGLESAFEVELESGNVAIVVFGRSAEYAASYRDLSGRLDSSFDYFPHSRANVTFLWQRTPSSGEAKFLEECLSENGAAVPLAEQDPSTAESFRYSAAERDRYLTACVRAGFVARTCRCILDWAQARYPAHEFRNALSRKAVVSAVVESCR